MKVTFGALRRIRGSTVSVTVNTDDNADAVLAKSVEKMLIEDSRVPSPPYVLLYPDGQLIDKLPGSEITFTVQGYKEFKGKSYQQLLLFVCQEEQFIELSISNDINDEVSKVPCLIQIYIRFVK